MLSCTVAVSGFSGANKSDLGKLLRVAERAGKIFGKEQDLSAICHDRVFTKATSIILNNTHPLHEFYEQMTSGRRFRSFVCRTSRFFLLKSFVPYRYFKW